MNEKEQDRLTVTTELRRALERGELDAKSINRRCRSIAARLSASRSVGAMAAPRARRDLPKSRSFPSPGTTNSCFSWASSSLREACMQARDVAAAGLAVP